MAPLSPAPSRPSTPSRAFRVQPPSPPRWLLAWPEPASDLASSLELIPACPAGDAYSTDTQIRSPAQQVALASDSLGTTREPGLEGAGGHGAKPSEEESMTMSI